MRLFLYLKNALLFICPSLYKGSTENIEQRLQSHNSGLVNFTSKHVPWEMVLFEEFETRSEAMKREKWYKSGVGRDWIKEQLAP